MFSGCPAKCPPPVNCPPTDAPYLLINPVKSPVKRPLWSNPAHPYGLRPWWRCCCDLSRSWSKTVKFSVGVPFDSKEALSRNVQLVEERTNGSLRDILRAFTLNPAACDSVLNDLSLIQLRSDCSAELVQQLKVCGIKQIWTLECPTQ